MIRVLLADDQALIRAGFRVLLKAAGDMQVVAEAVNGDQASRPGPRGARRRDLDGHQDAGHRRTQATKRIAADEDLAGVKVIILTTFESDEYVTRRCAPGPAGSW